MVKDHTEEMDQEGSNRSIRIEPSRNYLDSGSTIHSRKEFQISEVGLKMKYRTAKHDLHRNLDHHRIRLDQRRKDPLEKTKVGQNRAHKARMLVHPSQRRRKRAQPRRIPSPHLRGLHRPMDDGPKGTSGVNRPNDSLEDD